VTAINGSQLSAPPAVLTRAALTQARGVAADPAPIRIVHIGLGAFARAHQVWYTAQADDAGEWGIAAFTGRNPTVAEQLAPQDGLYTLIERSADGDRAEVVASLSEVVDGARVDRLVELIAAERTALVTMTVTESGYRLHPDGSPDLGDPAIRADLDSLRASETGFETPAPTTALGRLVLALAARRRAGSGPIAVVPCDNIPDNGQYVRTGVIALASAWETGIADWIASEVSFVSTSVDRITPRTTDEELEPVEQLTGWRDAAPVFTEPFADWILCGSFPAGRPEWERAGARFTDDIESFERRKLWLLNGAHSLLAYAGQLRGHHTVAAAIADETCADAVAALWDEACRHLPAELDLDAYREALLRRFGNGRIAHHLGQIEAEAVTKLRVRIVPIALAERAASRPASACASAIGAWVRLTLEGRTMVDAKRDAVLRALAAEDPSEALVAMLHAELAEDVEFMALVRAAAEQWGGGSTRTEEGR
jgi:fructuronate reductase